MQARQVVLAAALFGSAVMTAAGATGAQQSQARQPDVRERQEQFREMDRDNNGVITRAEWRGSVQSFRRYDVNRDGVLSGNEIWTDRPGDWTRERFARLDQNNDSAISRAEWRGERADFDRLDRNRDGFIERDELPASDERESGEPSSDRRAFADLDRNGNGVITSGEWTGTADEFRSLDTDDDGVVSAREYREGREVANSPAYRAGRERGLTDGRQAGREDKTINGGRWDLEGQRELETADAGYNESLGPRAQYQAGYRAGFRVGYREGFGPRQ
jgi:Ca2+-binding EF-hand superfamily protein